LLAGAVARVGAACGLGVGAPDDARAGLVAGVPALLAAVGVLALTS